MLSKLNDARKAGKKGQIRIELPDLFPERAVTDNLPAQIHICLTTGWELTGEYSAGTLRTITLIHPCKRGHQNG